MSDLKLRYRQTIHAIKFLQQIAKSTQPKYAFRWLMSLRKNYLLNKPFPWITFAAADFIEQRMKADWRVFEYGSGGSTLFWLKHGASCVSIEHDPAWYKLIEKRIQSAASIDYRLVLPEASDLSPLNKDAFADPALFLSSDENYRGYNFSRYVCQIDQFPDAYFDLIVIDGRARPSCIQRSVSKVKAGGLLLLDNADREYYLRNVEALLQDFECYKFNGVTPGLAWFTQTNIYVNQG